MLRKYPGLTLVSSLAMGVAIAVGAGGSTAISLITDPNLPLDEGDRIVGIQLWDLETRGVERRILHDVEDWRGMRTIGDVGTFRGVARNLVDDEGRSDVVRAAEMSASGFRVARVNPQLGRYLVDGDERAGAPRVVVIGYGLWRQTFGSDPEVIGRTMKFGAWEYTIVGVMPQGFAFPINYDLWVPPMVSVLDYNRGEGPALHAFGRLAPGATLDDARAELATLATLAAKAYPETHRTLQPRVMPYTQSWFELDDPDIVLALNTARFFMALLLVVICVNVAILVYARTATRQSEVAVRAALGASRSRIVAQLFGEALVLSALGAAVGLVILSAIAARIEQLLTQFGVVSMPFWLRFEISDTTLGWLVALAAVSAVIIGVIPGLQVTGRRVQLGLQRLAGGHIRMGRTWTALIIVEVALAVAIMPAAVRFATDWIAAAMSGPGFPAEQYLSASLTLEPQQPSGPATPEEARAFVAHFAQARMELARHLEEDPEVLQVTFTNNVPGIENNRRIEIDSLTQVDIARAKEAGVAQRFRYPRARSARVEVSFLRMFDVPLLAGRDFTLADTGASVLIVNRSFVDSLLDGHNAVGRRIRTVRLERNEPVTGPWQEIIGVVEDFPARPPFDSPRPAMYGVAAGPQLYPATLMLRTRGDPAGYGPRLRAIAQDADPALLVRNLGPLDAQIRSTHLPLQWLAISIGAITLSVLILSAAGVYALMSVIVTQRRREIGIRIALGADRRRVLSAVFSRAAANIGCGVAVGIALAVLLNRSTGGELLGGRSLAILASVALFMAGVGMLAALQPARRGLRIQPTEALKAE